MKALSYRLQPRKRNRCSLSLARQFSILLQLKQTPKCWPVGIREKACPLPLYEDADTDWGHHPQSDMAQYLKAFWGGKKGSLALPENQFIQPCGICERAVDTFFLKESISSYYLAETQLPSLTKFPKTKSSVSQIICPLLPERTKKWGTSQTRCRFKAISSPHT